MFFLKELLAHCFLPVPLCAGLLLLGLLLRSFSKWQKLGRGLVFAGMLLFLLFSYPWLPRLALSHLERQYPAVAVDGGRRTEDGGRKAEDGSRFIMVLGQGFSADRNRSPAARFSDEGLKRIIEGVRLHRCLTNSMLLVSIAEPTVSGQEKERVAGELLLLFGLATNAVQVCGGARDTEDEIAWCKRLAGTNRVWLVSSASHLPRAMLLARRHGLAAIPAPSGYLVDTVTRSPWAPHRLFPSSINLYDSERAMHEYLGLAWEWGRSRQRTED